MPLQGWTPRQSSGAKGELKVHNQMPQSVRMWNASLKMLDWRRLLRKWSGHPKVDAVFVSNFRDETDRDRYLANWKPDDGMFNGPRYWINGIAGHTQGIDISPRELETSSGRRRARDIAISAIEKASMNGAKIILLAAGTKRLFGHDGYRLRKLFPGLIFTIGDNGTMLALQLETFRALKMAGLRPGHSRIAVIGPYGFLGEKMVGALRKKGHDVIGVGPSVSRLNKIAERYQIEICKHFAGMPVVDAVVACTHSHKIRLKPQSIEGMRRNGKKLLVVDVSEPSNLVKEEHEKCRDKVIRQDAGNAYSRNLRYVLGPIAYRMFRHTRGVTFGCFAETLVLASALRRGEDVASRDWFQVNEQNMEFVARLFKREGFTIPSPRCFGKIVRSFDLDL